MLYNPAEGSIMKYTLLKVLFTGAFFLSTQVYALSGEDSVLTDQDLVGLQAQIEQTFTGTYSQKNENEVAHTLQGSSEFFATSYWAGMFRQDLSMEYLKSLNEQALNAEPAVQTAATGVKSALYIWALGFLKSNSKVQQLMNASNEQLASVAGGKNTTYYSKLIQLKNIIAEQANNPVSVEIVPHIESGTSKMISAIKQDCSSLTVYRDCGKVDRYRVKVQIFSDILNFVKINNEVFNMDLAEIEKEVEVYYMFVKDGDKLKLEEIYGVVKNLGISQYFVKTKIADLIECNPNYSKACGKEKSYIK